jgi:hypothetical protein
MTCWTSATTTAIIIYTRGDESKVYNYFITVNGKSFYG